MLNRTARILKAAAALKRSPSSSKSQDGAKNTAYLPSSGEESEPFPGSESSYQPSEVSDIQNITSDESDAETSGSDVNNQPVTEPVNPTVTNNDTWGPCGIISNNFPFTGQSGFNSTDFRDSYKIYRLFIDDEVLDIIVRETNRYADQFIRSNELPRRSFVRKWTETNNKEIQKFIGILLIVGMNHLPKMRLYWSKNPMYRNELICKNMTRSWFDLLLKFIHFSDNEQNRRNPDRLVKVKEVLDRIQKNFQDALKPEGAVVIDETMIPWRGRLVFRQYLPAKSHKYGIKVYKLCKIDAYTYGFKIYCGKNENVSDHGHTFDVTIKLMEGLLNEGRILYADNFYVSVKLGEYLLQNGTYLCGTLRSNRKGNPKDVCSKKLKKGEMYALENSKGVRVYKWVDKKPVIMLSTLPEHMDELVATGRKNKKEEEIRKPRCILDYNNSKKGVDISDQMSSYYTSLRKTIKWYKKAVFEIILGTAVVNAWVIYKQNTGKKMDMLAFREHLVKRLFEKEDNVDDGEIEDDQDIPVPQKNKLIHKLQKIEGTARKNRKRCISCYEKLQKKEGAKVARAKAKRVMTCCKSCENSPSLCLECFNEKHRFQK